MGRHALFTTKDRLRCKSELLAQALVTKKSIYIGDLLLHYDGLLRTYKLKDAQLPTSLQANVPAIDVLLGATCEDYLNLALGASTHFHMDSVFPGHNRHLDFDEVEIGAHSWQPKLDAIQDQISDLDSTYAQDAEVVAAFADQIAASGDVFALVAAKVAVEKLRAETEEAAIQADVDTNQSVADADRLDIRADYIVADTVVSDSVAAEAATARGAESVLTAAVATEEARAKLAEASNLAAVDVEKARVTAILALSAAELDTFKEIEEAYKLADQNVQDTVTNLVNARVLIATPVMTGQCQAQGGIQTTDVVGNNELLLRSIGNSNVRIEPSGNGTVEVSKAMNCAAVASTAFSQAGQAVLDASSSVEDLSDVTSKGSGAIITTSERTRVGWVDVTSSVQGFVDDRQTTAAADVKYRLKTDSLSKTDAETADSQRVLESVFNSAIGARQTTTVQEATYRKITDSYSQSQVYTQSAADAEFYDRSTLDTEFGTKEDSLDANGTLVVAAHPYVTADKDKVAANHLKLSYTLVEQAKVGVNDLKLSYELTEKAKVTANGAAIVTHTADIAANVTSLGQKYATSVAEAKHIAQALLIDANTSKISYSAVEQAKVTANGLKTSYDATASALAATHTLNIASNLAVANTKYASSDASAKHTTQDALISKVSSGTLVTSSGAAFSVGTNSVVILNHESLSGNQLITLPTPVVVGKQIKILITKNGANFHWKLQCGGSDIFHGGVIAVNTSTSPDEVTHHVSNSTNDSNMSIPSGTRQGSWVQLVGVSAGIWAISGVIIHAASVPNFG